ncbi:MAG: NADH-quinone oxidoreductase subunit M [Campylobacterales bacterium]|nr:NADH-quinone oxidoreductase subunit M [Campylobacterales bacterium]
MLSILIFLPIAVAFCLLVLPVNATQTRNGALVTGVVIFLLSLSLYGQFEPVGGMQFEEFLPWITTYGIGYSVGLDGVSLIILMLIATLMPCAYMLLWKGRTKGYWVSMLLIQGGMLGALMAQDLILFYLFWETMLLPVFMIVGMFGTGDKVFSTLKVTLYTMLGSLLMFIAILYLGASHAREFGHWSFELSHLTHLTHLSWNERAWLFGAFMLAFAIKIPLFPFHTWLLKTYSNAPTGGVFLLSAIMAKLGVYGVIRFVLPLFPEHSVYFAPWVMGVGLFGLVYFGIAALMQDDVKKLLAYSSASHLGFIVVGVFSLNVYGMMGALLLIVAHAMATGGLFLLVGHLEFHTKTKSIRALGGIATRAPVFTVYFALFMLCIVGLPGTSGFVSELLIILGVFHVGIPAGMVAALSVLVAASFMLWMFGRVTLQEEQESAKTMVDLSWKQGLGLLPIALLIVAMGLDPEWFFAKIEPTVLDYLGGILGGVQ